MKLNGFSRFLLVLIMLFEGLFLGLYVGSYTSQRHQGKNPDKISVIKDLKELTK